MPTRMHRDWPVFVTALFPTAFFLTAVYPKSLTLVLSVGAFWMARHGRWAWAGLLGGLGAATHPLALLLVVPLGLFDLREHRWRLRIDVLWLALIPAGYGAFMLYYVGLRGLDPFSVLRSHEIWLRFSTRGPSPTERGRRFGPRWPGRANCSRDSPHGPTGARRSPMG